MAKTVGEMMASINEWARETVKESIVFDAINDACEALWMEAMKAVLSNFVQGPISSLSFASASERQDLISIASPAQATIPITSITAVWNGFVTTLTVICPSAHGLGLAMSVVIAGSSVPAYNIPNLTVTSIDSAVQFKCMTPANIAGAAAVGGTVIQSLNVVTTGGFTRALYYAFSLVTESGSETLISLPQLFTEDATVTVTGPPWVLGAFGWNLYVGPASDRMSRQNDVPLDFGDTIAEPPASWNFTPDAPTAPTTNTTGDDIFYIRHMELLLPDGTYKPWDQVDLDSEMFRRASHSISSTSPYQAYMWDLLNQRTVEIRPGAGLTLNPRFFYVQKPRRMRFKNCLIPFQAIPFERFIRFHALADIVQTFYEDDQSIAWTGKAQQELVRIVTALTQMNHGKDARVTPFLY